MIELRHVTRRYGAKRAVDDVSFSVADGESIALWGSNGAGKTTLLRCLLGTTRYEGEITVDGIAPNRDGRAARQRIGYVPQTMPTFDLTVSEMVVLVARLRDADPRQGIAQLERFGLGHTLKQTLARLAGGLRQKLALTLALLGDARVLLLDEPTANLDAQSQAELITMLVELKAHGRTIVFTSHRWSEVRALADRVVTLDQGRCVGIGSVAETARIADEVQLRVDLLPETVAPAVALLREHGYATERHGDSALVTVDTRKKAEPLVLLARSRYAVTDFTVEDET